MDLALVLAWNVVRLMFVFLNKRTQQMFNELKMKLDAEISFQDEL